MCLSTDVNGSQHQEHNIIKRHLRSIDPRCFLIKLKYFLTYLVCVHRKPAPASAGQVHRTAHNAPPKPEIKASSKIILGDRR